MFRFHSILLVVLFSQGSISHAMPACISYTRCENNEILQCISGCIDQCIQTEQSCNENNDMQSFTANGRGFKAHFNLEKKEAVQKFRENSRVKEVMKNLPLEVLSSVGPVEAVVVDFSSCRISAFGCATSILVSQILHDGTLSWPRLISAIVTIATDGEGKKSFSVNDMEVIHN